MTLTVALAGDTMLGRGVAQRLAERRGPVVAPEVAEVAAEADLFVLNLECCISERGERWPDPAKPFFFRAPPAGAEVLADLGVDCVTLANNHALDYGVEALLDTFRHLDAAGLAWVGAGPDVGAARRPAVLRAGGRRLTVIGVSDHPSAFAAGVDRPGIAFADLGGAGVPDWLLASVGGAEGPVLVSPHWGPNMTARPIPAVRAAADALAEAGAALVAGHSAHVFHGVRGPVLYDLGDFVDDYAVDAHLRNDLGLLFLATLDGGRLAAVEAVPLKLDYCHTRLALGEEAAWIARRFREACAALGAEAVVADGRLRVAG
jgi:poly-gamma-glutamate capsule biosynthesis protein CapA/YwtB (metallophosphatase superfamily)